MSLIAMTPRTLQLMIRLRPSDPKEVRKPGPGWRIWVCIGIEKMGNPERKCHRDGLMRTLSNLAFKVTGVTSGKETV